MSDLYTVFARQGDAPGMDVCSVFSTDEPSGADEVFGQFGRWERGVNFMTADELGGGLLMLAQPIIKLGISCHGSMVATDPDTFGGVALNGTRGPWLRVNNMPPFMNFINLLNALIAHHGTVFFFSCSVGSTEPGRRLLMALSSRWPTRRVIGFDAEGHQQHGGQFLRGEHCDQPGLQFEHDRWGDDNIPGAVIARDGRIIRG